MNKLKFCTHLSTIFNKKNKKFNKGRRYGGPLFIFGCCEV